MVSAHKSLLLDANPSARVKLSKYLFSLDRPLLRKVPQHHSYNAFPPVHNPHPSPSNNQMTRSQKDRPLHSLDNYTQPDINRSSCILPDSVVEFIFNLYYRDAQRLFLPQTAAISTPFYPLTWESPCMLEAVPCSHPAGVAWCLWLHS